MRCISGATTRRRRRSKFSQESRLRRIMSQLIASLVVGFSYLLIAPWAKVFPHSWPHLFPSLMAALMASVSSLLPSPAALYGASLTLRQNLYPLPANGAYVDGVSPRSLGKFLDSYLPLPWGQVFQASSHQHEVSRMSGYRTGRLR